MPQKKKSKYIQYSSNSKWIEMKDGSFSLVIEPKKSIGSNKVENINNKLKKLVKKTPEKSKSRKNEIPFETQNITAENASNSDNVVQSSPDKETMSNPSACTSGVTKDLAALRLVDDGKIHLKETNKPLNGLCSNVQPNCVQNGSIKIDNRNNKIDEHSDESDDDSFFDQLFTDSPAKPKTQYISAPTDSFPFGDDSDSELVIEPVVKFSFNKNKSTAVAEFGGMEYPIGFLDLTSTEHTYLRIIAEAKIELSFNPSHIVIQDGKLNIKRIHERQISLKPDQPIALWSEVLSIGRIQFSTTEPLLAKYENNVYFVGNTLHAEYTFLLGRTKRNMGTAIRIRKNRIEINTVTQTIDINKTVSFGIQKICVIAAANDNHLRACDSIAHRRFIIRGKPYEVLEIEQNLLHSTIHDEVTEIYAENDFPFGNADEVRTIKDDATVSKTVKESKANATMEQARKTTKIFKFNDNEELEMHRLNEYAVPEDIKFLIDNKNLPREELAVTRFGELSRMKSLRNKIDDYIEGHKMMIHMEEQEQLRYIETFNQTNIQITYYMDRQFTFPLPNIELAGAVEENFVERFILIPKGIRARKDIWGQVIRLRGQDVIIEIYPESFKAVLKRYQQETYDIFFMLNRTPYQLQHYALDFIKCEQLFTKLIDNSYYKCKSFELTPVNGLPQTQNHAFIYAGMALSKLNNEQQSAVKNIISKVDKLPYVLFGPPGTGKTRTLVATIEQIVRTTNQKILVCAMSNAACDEITERLIDILEFNEVYRLYAKSYKNGRISPKIGKWSNFSSQYISYPSLKYLYQYRVLVCTLCSAGCLTRARIDDEWNPEHFDYVFIDECASAPEAMCLVPIAGLCTSYKEIHAKIILAGDPKQLDAVTRSYKAKRLGYNTSWLEQLCRMNLYSRHSQTGQFNPMYITQLVKNYRSHPEILSIPNELFYEKKLEALAAASDINWYINSKFLPSKKFPIVFKSVQGTCTQSIEGSCFNNKEIDEVINVLKQLLPPKSKELGLRQITQSDIGVVTPYRKQRFRLTQRLRYLSFDEVTVGTAEVFQGKEKPVMIITTVRTDGKLGFVEDEKRLNVVVTRAKCLLVIIGDPHTLSLNTNWRRLIEVCIQHNSFIQGDKNFSLGKLDTKKKKQKNDKKK